MPVDLRQPMLVLLLQQPMPNLRLVVQGGGAVFDQRVARHLQFLTRSDHRLPGGALPEAPPGLDHLKAHSSPIVNKQAENGARGPVAGHAPVAPLPSCHKPGRTNLGPLSARPHLFPVPDRLPGRPTSDPGGPGLRRLYGRAIFGVWCCRSGNSRAVSLLRKSAGLVAISHPRSLNLSPGRPFLVCKNTKMNRPPACTYLPGFIT